MFEPVVVFGFEVGRFYPALALIFLVLVGVLGRKVYAKAIKKQWSGKRETNPVSRIRISSHAALFSVGVVFLAVAFADVSLRFVVIVNEYVTKRVYVQLDNSSSMWKLEIWKTPIYCSAGNVAHVEGVRPNLSVNIDEGLRQEYPRIYGACRMAFRIIDLMEAFTAKKKDTNRKDKLSLMRFASNSFVVMYPSGDYGRARIHMRSINWRDPRTGISTAYHLALWDMFQVALQKNFCIGNGVCAPDGITTSLSEKERVMLMTSLRPEGIEARWTSPDALVPKLEALRTDLKNAAFIILTDADYRWFRNWLDAPPVSLVKMLQMAEFLEVPIYFISMVDDHKLVRALSERTGSGPLGGPDRGAFYLLKGEKNYEDMDAVVDNILSRRMRIEAREETRRESYTPRFGLLAALTFLLGVVSWLSVGREIGKGGVP